MKPRIDDAVASSILVTGGTGTLGGSSSRSCGTPGATFECSVEADAKAWRISGRARQVSNS
jgi:hypothetical protein